MSTPENDPPPDRPASRPRRWRRYRPAFIAVGLIVLAPLILLFVLTRSWFIAGRADPVLERLLGGEVTIGHVHYAGDGNFVFRDVSLQVPSHPGRGGEVCHVGRMTVTLDMDRLVRGDVKVEDVEVSDMLIRLSERSDTAGAFNFMDLKPDWATMGADKGLLPPRVQISRVAVEIGTHDANSYTPGGRRMLSGSMRPVEDREGWYEVTAIEVDENGNVRADDALLVDGQFDLGTNEHAFHIEGVELNPRSRAMCPKIALIWWDEMDLQGRVASVDVHWSTVEGFRVEFDIDAVSLTLPIDTTDFWARYRAGGIEAMRSRARMRVNRGKIVLTASSVVLDRLEGEFVSTDDAPDVIGIPYKVSLDLDEIPEVDWKNKTQWMADVLATAPFRMRFHTGEFRVEREHGGEPPAVELPLAVAQALAKFQMSDWVLSTEIEIWRGDPGPDAGDDTGFGPPVASPTVIQSRGRAYISNALGRYKVFPYPLGNVDAFLAFDNDTVKVHYLTGEGPTGARVRLSGEISSLTDESTIDLKVTARDVPVDHYLIEALSEDRQRVASAVLHQPSFDALRAAGLLPDQTMLEIAAGTLETKRREVADLRGSVAALGETATIADHSALERAEDSLRRLIDLIDAGPFQLGGVVDLDLDIVRHPEIEDRTNVTGLVKIQSLGLLFDRFPYPIRITGGVIDWQTDAVSVRGEDGGGLSIATPGGGDGLLIGRIGIVREDGKVRLEPDVSLRIEGDEINELLFAALPPTAAEREEPAIRDDWPGQTLTRVARELQRLALSGRLDYTARLAIDDARQLAYEITVDLEGGHAEPVDTIAALVGRAGFSELGDWEINECRGRLTITRDGATLESFAGVLETGRGPGRIEIDGRIVSQPAPGNAAFNVRIDEMPVTDGLLGLLPEDTTDAWQTAWRRYRPEGTLDAALAYRRSGGEEPTVALTVQPRELRVQLPESVITFRREDGHVRVDEQGLHLVDLVLSIDDGRTQDGRLRLRGTIGRAGGPVEGEWDRGQFDSPLLLEMIGARYGVDRAERYASYAPKGVFDAKVRSVPAREGQPRAYTLRIEPQSVALQVRETPIHFHFDPTSAIVLRPGVIELQDIEAEQIAGTLSLAGVIRTDDGLHADLALGYEGRLMSAQVLAFLPAGIRRTVETLSLQEGRPSRLRDGRLRLERSAGSTVIDSEFSATLEVDDASFRAGLEFTELTGSFTLDIAHYPGREIGLAIEARSGQARMLGHQLRDIEATIRLDEDAQMVRLEQLRANARQGTVTAVAKVGIRENREYVVEVQLADVPLSDFLMSALDGETHGGTNGVAGADPPDRTHAIAALVEDDETPHRLESGGGVYADLAISGTRGDPDSRVGRGVARLIDEGLKDIPLGVRLLQPFHATLPVGDWDYANAEFYIRGNRVIIEEILFESSLNGMFVQHLEGSGEVNMTTWDIHANFRSRGGVLLVRDLIGGIGDQLASLEVTGRLWDPEVKVVTLPGIRGSRDHDPIEE